MMFVLIALVPYAPHLFSNEKSPVFDQVDPGHHTGWQAKQGGYHLYLLKNQTSQQAHPFIFSANNIDSLLFVLR